MGPVAIIFGGSKGIGHSIALKFWLNGYRVAITSRQKINDTAALKLLANRPDGNILQNDLYKSTPIMGFQCDVTREQDIQDCLKQVEGNWCTPSVVVNSAGISEDNLLVKTNLASMHSIINTNLIGPMLTSKWAARSMLKNREGTIINIGSIVGSCGNIGQVAYSSSKAGLVGLTKSLAKELGSKGIRVNLVTPGFIETDMTAGLNSEKLSSAIPLRRFGKPEEVANAVYFLATAKYITGEVFIVDGGLHLG